MPKSKLTKDVITVLETLDHLVTNLLKDGAKLKKILTSMKKTEKNGKE